MGFSIGCGSKKEWEIVNMRLLQRTKQGNTKTPFSPFIYLTGPRYIGREEFFFFPGWL